MKTKKKYVLSIIAIMLILATIYVSPVIAGSEDTSSGEASVGNAAPTITNPGLFTTAPADANNTNLTVDVEYRSNCTITDENQLTHIENVTWTIWEDTYADVGDADSNVNHYTFAYLNDTDAFDEIGPDGGGDSHLVAGSCSDPADHTATSGEFKLAFKLHATANYTATKTWKIQIKVYDGSDATDTDSTLIFGVSFTAELTVNDNSHSWSNLTPGSNDNDIDSPGDHKIDITITANDAFDVQVKGDGDLTKGSDTIDIGNVTHYQSDTVGSSVAMTTSYVDIGGLPGAGYNSGESQAKEVWLWLDVPSGTPLGTYTYTLYVQTIQH